MGVGSAPHTTVRTLDSVTREPAISAPTTRALGLTLHPHGSVALDRALACFLFVADVVWLGVLTVRGDRTVAEGGGLAVVSAVVAGGFLWRRRRPVALVALVVVGYVAAAAIHGQSLATQVTGAAVVLAVYALGSWSEHRRWAISLMLVAAVVVTAGALGDGTGVVESLSFSGALLGAPWFAGSAGRMRRRHLDAVEARLRQVESERDERARLAVIEERARIARELHDVVAHHVSLIGVQAGAARTMLGRDTDHTHEALLAIESSSRDAVREMRQLLDVLGTAGSGIERAPAPGLAEFGRLCDSYAVAGLTVQRTTSGTVDRLSPLHAVTLYRIIEEALTNVSRHSTAARCAVHLHADEHGARVVITDPGPSKDAATVSPRGSGRGLVGMRERVDVFNGTIVTGPTTSATWVIDAWLPVDEQ